jgi:hypothetical protein
LNLWILVRSNFLLLTNSTNYLQEPLEGLQSIGNKPTGKNHIKFYLFRINLCHTNKSIDEYQNRGGVKLVFANIFNGIQFVEQKILSIEFRCSGQDLTLTSIKPSIF